MNITLKSFNVSEFIITSTSRNAANYRSGVLYEAIHKSLYPEQDKGATPMNCDPLTHFIEILEDMDIECSIQEGLRASSGQVAFDLGIDNKMMWTVVIDFC